MKKQIASGFFAILLAVTCVLTAAIVKKDIAYAEEETVQTEETEGLFASYDTVLVLEAKDVTPDQPIEADVLPEEETQAELGPEEPADVPGPAEAPEPEEDTETIKEPETGTEEAGPETPAGEETVSDDAEEADPGEDLEKEKDEALTVSYQTHVQDIGWQDWVSDGSLSGTTGRSKRLEGIRIQVSGIEDSGIEYCTHVQNIGWQDWVRDGALGGTTGRSLRLEAIRIRLTGGAAANYDVYYCTHVQGFGWLNWAKNGEMSGTAGYSKRLEGIMIRVLPKGSAAPAPQGSTLTTYRDSSGGSMIGANGYQVIYNTHVQNIGWQDWVGDGASGGTSGQSKRLEGMHIRLQNQTAEGSIEYRTHVQSIGWQDWVKDGALAGTTGRSLRLEALQIRLTGEMAEQYDVWYRTHCQRTGWMGWACNGEMAGTEGYAYRMEAVQICLVEKGAPAPGPTANAYQNFALQKELSLDSAEGGKTIEAFGGYALSNSLRSRLQSAVDQAKAGKYSIGFVMMDIRTGKGVAYNADERFYSASTVKAPYVASVAYTDPSSIKKHELTMKMILQISSNEAYYSLRKAYGAAPLQNWASIAGVSNSSMHLTFVWYSARELAKLWLLNYRFFETGSTGGTVGSWMQSPNISIIRPVLAKRYTIRSKAGWINTANKAFSDAGIVYAGNGPYVLVVLTNYPSSGESRLYPLIEALDACHQTM